MRIFSKILKVLLPLALLGVVFMIVYQVVLKNKTEKEKAVFMNQLEQSKSNQDELLMKKNDEMSEKNELELEKSVLPAENKTVFSDMQMLVPFTVQAPFGKWDNPLFQNGCEEASIAMAMNWVRGKTFTAKSAEKEILDISAWEDKTFGQAVDSSVDDIARILREHYGYQNFEVMKDVNLDDIKLQLKSSRVVLVPMNGKILANPHFTPPGPDQHMLVVVGYDSEADEFITNDPGTKFGANYHYAVSKFMDAIWSYPSGAEHAIYPGRQKSKKAMVSIWK
ncbi:MAG: hypothetical protein HGA36_03240 [Candidatus Moranbacteria bacterium]|nr:hypothetical protein [Candidatus Moranbacteria bacterium]